ncbi:MAG: hypothetical protein DI537_57705 [Stutzerimonas stutzeri]|nr:MAG: hypothetical protein DI537_57705 [Stutzerimonas stutzeri]
MTQAAFAARAGIGLKTLRRLERYGRASPATIALVEKALDLEPFQFVAGWTSAPSGIGPKIRARRLAKEVTTAEVEEQLRIRRSTQSRLERGLGPDADSRWRQILNPNGRGRSASSVSRR